MTARTRPQPGPASARPEASLSSAAALREALRDTGVRAWPVIRAVLAGTMALGSAVGLSAVAAWMIARAAQMPSAADLALAAVIVRFFGISRGVFRYLERLASHDTALRGMVELRERTYEHLAAAGAGRVLTLRRGDIIARIGTDLDAVGDAVVRALIPTGVAITVSLISVAVVGLIIPVAGVVLAACLLIAGLGSAALTARQARIAAEAGVVAHAEVSSASLAAIESATEHRMWGTTAASLTAVESANHDAEAALEAESKPGAAAAALLTLSQGVAVIGGVWLAVHAIGNGAVSGPWGTVVALLPLAAFEAVGAIPAAVLQLHRSRAAALRLRELSAPLADGAFADSAAVDPEPAAAASTVAELRLDELSVAWPGMTPTRPLTERLVPGQTLAIVGPSGIGKSTILLAIAGALRPHRGTVLVDGEPAGPADTGRRIALTAEDAHIFETTVLENLRVARGDVTEDEALEALTTVGLRAWIDTLPRGIDTMLGSGGHTVSGGERRRLLLARALLHPAPVVLIDEPAEHLDDEGQDALRAVVMSMTARQRIVVLVTHHESPLGYAERQVDLRE
ncbi:thiol reductant ABC exporter subunit CydC [Demequina capsici]|uniref:Thiol reductant ABC exporter subunit CydC n=1 Tax=Demequina capsici TaxID=3075620 RepID=A0AA96JGT0_9MICO|nr:thiol reductant ABC exporter subunit CydC [Demequina sp. PMTSA13]WNM28274.1 thiol reductant ABC exporter subunit CydC [Demequina sp. PMTSA13]